MSTKLTLRALREALEADAALGPLADVFARYDGEPADAIEEHVADLRGAAGASVLVGFLADDVTESDEEGRALGVQLRPSVLVVRRRGPRDGMGSANPDDVPGATLDAEAVDDLYDAAAAALEAAGWSIRRGRALAGDARDWFGRALVVERARDTWPLASSAPLA